jgi:hypothetical protein
MSTEHKGDYCAHKDKMILSRQEAAKMAGRLRMTYYSCEHCKGWHTAHRTKPLKTKRRR